MAENGASHHLGLSGAPSDGGSAAHAALSLAVCNSVVTVLITPEVCELPPIRRQGDPASRRTDHPSQDRRSLGYLVSSPPLATNHES